MGIKNSKNQIYNLDTITIEKWSNVNKQLKETHVKFWYEEILIKGIQIPKTLKEIDAEPYDDPAYIDLWRFKTLKEPL